LSKEGSFGAGFSSATGQNDNQSAILLRILRVELNRFNTEGVKKTKMAEAAGGRESGDGTAKLKG
jgi:hypothetical protein